MPELPEVETILRSLEPKALGHVIRKVTVIHEKTIMASSLV
jgi:formamidopyrimidine-DNA glycosylase